VAERYSIHNRHYDYRVNDLVRSPTADGFGRAARLVEAFTQTFDRPNTATAYRVDLTGCGYPLGGCRHTDPARWHSPLAWLPWTAAREVDPFDVRPTVVQLWLADLAGAGQAAGTRARRLSAVSSWYAMLDREGLVPRNPCAAIDPKNRPKRRTPGTAGTALSERQAARILAAADADGPRTAALIALMLIGGARVSDTVTADRADIGEDQERPVLTIVTKGDNHHQIPLPPPVHARITAYLAVRPAPQPNVPALAAGTTAAEPLFVTATGRRLSRAWVLRLVARMGERIGVAGLTPHDLRRTFATMAIEDGIPLADVQDAMGHADPRTTRAYDRRRHNPDRHPAHRLAAKIAAAM
jgi:integrase/recombinase XerD